jgi:hypothetical protein
VSTESPAGDELPPLLTVVKGEPTPVQLAALVAVVCSLRPVEGEPQTTAPDAEDAPGVWGAPAVRSTLAPGPGAWRASGLPGQHQH